MTSCDKWLSVINSEVLLLCIRPLISYFLVYISLAICPSPSWSKIFKHLFSQNAVFIFYWCVTNYQKFHSLKWQNLWSHSFCELRLWHILAESSTQGLIKVKSRCQPSASLYGSLTRKKFNSKLIPVVYRIYVLAAI